MKAETSKTGYGGNYGNNLLFSWARSALPAFPLRQAVLCLRLPTPPASLPPDSTFFTPSPLIAQTMKLKLTFILWTYLIVKCSHSTLKLVKQTIFCLYHCSETSLKLKPSFSMYGHLIDIFYISLKGKKKKVSHFYHKLCTLAGCFSYCVIIF